LVWRGRYAADLIVAWQRWAPTGLDELDATLRLRIPANDARPRVEIVGTLLGTEADTTDLLADLVRRTATEPDVEGHRLLPYRMAKRSLAGDGLLNGSGHTSLDADESGELLTKSDFFRRQIPPDAINHLIANLTQNTAGTHRRESHSCPGAVHTTASPPTRRRSRTARSIPHPAPARAHPERVRERTRLRSRLARAILGALHSWVSGGVYPNFPDPDLDGWHHAYFAETVTA
jgi:hypothetical protein